MAAPELLLSADDPLSSPAELLVLGVIKDPDGPRLAWDDPRLASVAAALGTIGATGSAEELRRLPGLSDGGPAIALVGLGAAEDLEANPEDVLRSAAGAALRQLVGAESLAFVTPFGTSAALGALLEGAAIAAYSFPDYLTKEQDAKRPARSITVHAVELPPDADALVKRAAVIATAVHTVRDLVNTPPNDLAPADLARRAFAYASGLPIALEELDEAELAEGGYGGILGVGQGSSRPPRLVVLRYAPEEAKQHLALVGKGITFDSGGLSLKPPASMVGMKYDMTGAATVLAVTVAAARLSLPVRITAWLCLAENLPSGTALRPNDVIRIRNRMTVEVLNTDAEGRLVLADGLSAASEEQPDAIVDVATLTGAARTAMGERIIPVMGDEDLARRMIDLGAKAGERFWAMPLPEELRSVLDSDVADIANAKPGHTAGGMLVAAQFLRAFVGTRPDGAPIPWAHLDIAGAANNNGSAYGVTPKGPTGATVRTLVALAEDFASKY